MDLSLPSERLRVLGETRLAHNLQLNVATERCRMLPRMAAALFSPYFLQKITL